MNLKQVGLDEEWSDVIGRFGVGGDSRSRVLDVLKSFYKIVGNTDEDGVAVINVPCTPAQKRKVNQKHKHYNEGQKDIV